MEAFCTICGSLTRNTLSLLAIPRLRELLGKLSVPAFFGVLLVLGIGTYRDYGVAFDESTQRAIGGVTAKYLAERFAPSLATSSMGEIGDLATFPDRDYGVAF